MGYSKGDIASTIDAAKWRSFPPEIWDSRRQFQFDLSKASMVKAPLVDEELPCSPQKNGTHINENLWNYDTKYCFSFVSVDVNRFWIKTRSARSSWQPNLPFDAGHNPTFKAAAAECQGQDVPWSLEMGQIWWKFRFVILW